MLDRRWFVTPELLDWRRMSDRGEYRGPLFAFPHGVPGKLMEGEGRELGAVSDVRISMEGERILGYPVVEWADPPKAEIAFGPIEASDLDEEFLCGMREAEEQIAAGLGVPATYTTSTVPPPDLTRKAVRDSMERLAALKPPDLPGLTMGGITACIDSISGRLGGDFPITARWPLYLDRNNQWNRLGAFVVRTCEYLGERVQIRFPMAPKGPYRARRQRRLYCDPKNWRYRGKGEYWIVDGREVWCHPDDFEKLKAALSR